MRKLWKIAAGKIKDRNSLWMVTLTRRSRHGQVGLEAAVIKATNHDDSIVDYKNSQRVFTWVRTSSTHLIVFLWALTRRVERTRNWVVALKSLILVHGVLCTKAPGTRKIGRLPFDLPSFKDAYDDFVHAYFTFLDLKSVVLAAELKDEIGSETIPGDADKAQMMLVRVQRWQNLLDALLEVRPHGAAVTNQVVVLEAMDCMIIEVFELYSKICDGIAKALMKVYKDKVEKAEASMALDVLQKASRQGQQLSDYFQLLKKIGLLHTTECPKIQQIPEEDFSELKRIINGAKDTFEAENKSESTMVEYEKAEVDEKTAKPRLTTVISEKWEVFEDHVSKVYNAVISDPFAASLNFPPVMHFNPFLDYGGTPSQVAISLV